MDDLQIIVWEGKKIKLNSLSRKELEKILDKINDQETILKQELDDTIRELT